MYSQSNSVRLSISYPSFLTLSVLIMLYSPFPGRKSPSSVGSSGAAAWFGGPLPWKSVGVPLGFAGWRNAAFFGAKWEPSSLPQQSFSLSKKDSDVSELTRPRLYAFGRADSESLFPQLFYKNKAEERVFRIKDFHCRGFAPCNPTSPSEKRSKILFS